MRRPKPPWSPCRPLSPLLVREREAPQPGVVRQLIAGVDDVVRLVEAYAVAAPSRGHVGDELAGLPIEDAELPAAVVVPGGEKVAIGFGAVDGLIARAHLVVFGDHFRGLEVPDGGKLLLLIAAT